MMTSVDPNEVARNEAIDFARRLVQRWQETLGAELLGAYLIGSLAHAGFNRRYSDIDLAIVTGAGLSQDALDSLKSKAIALSGDWGSKVSIFWSDRHFSRLRTDGCIDGATHPTSDDPVGTRMGPADTRGRDGD